MEAERKASVEVNDLKPCSEAEISLFFIVLSKAVKATVQCYS